MSSGETTKETTKKKIRGTIKTADLVNEYKLYHMINYKI